MTVKTHLNTETRTRDPNAVCLATKDLTCLAIHVIWSVRVDPVFVDAMTRLFMRHTVICSETGAIKCLCQQHQQQLTSDARANDGRKIRGKGNVAQDDQVTQI